MRGRVNTSRNNYGQASGGTSPRFGRRSSASPLVIAFMLILLFSIFQVLSIAPFSPFVQSVVSIMIVVIIGLGIVGIASAASRSRQIQENTDTLPVRQPVPSTTRRFCYYCGSATTTRGSRFCANCGASLTIAQEDETALDDREAMSPIVGQSARALPRVACIVCSLGFQRRDLLLWCPHCGGIAHRVHMLEWLHVNNTCPACGEHLDEQELTEQLVQTTRQKE